MAHITPEKLETTNTKKQSTATPNTKTEDNQVYVDPKDLAEYLKLVEEMNKKT